MSRIVAGQVVRIKRLDTPGDLSNRLRELGFCEDQEVKLLSRQTNILCMVCNTRLAISSKIADQIFVEPAWARHARTPHAS